MSGVSPLSHKFYVMHHLGGELLDQRRLADSPAPTARHKRRRTLPPQLGKRLQLLFSSYEHVTILHWEMAALYQIATCSASEFGVN